MAIYEKDQVGRLYWTVREGKLVSGKDETLKEAEAISGTFTGITMWFDEGNKEKKIKPSYKIQLTIEDEDSSHRVQCRASTHFAASMAGQFEDLNKGDYIKLKVKPGKDGVVNFCNIFKATDEGQWEPVTWVQLPKDDEIREEKVKDLVTSHPAYYESKTTKEEAQES